MGAKYPEKVTKHLEEVKGYKITEKFEEVMAMGGKTLEEVLEQSGLTAKWEARAEERNKAKIEKIAQNLIKKGLKSEEIAEMTELDLTDVLSLREQCEA